jgi:hypothetical protein
MALPARAPPQDLDDRSIFVTDILRLDGVGVRLRSSVIDTCRRVPSRSEIHNHPTVAVC